MSDDADNANLSVGPCIDTDGDTVCDALDSDDDNDTYADTLEASVGTNPLDDCPATTTANDEPLDALPPDLDDNGIVNVLDVTQLLPPAFGSTPLDSDYSIRKDLQPDGVINVLDVFSLLPPTFGSGCDPEY